MENILNFIGNLPSAILPLVFLLGLLIAVHEFGHFIVARLCGVRVETFSLGFGKKIFQYKKGDTTYCLSLFPLGGYVKMFGEQPGDHISEADKAFSFTHKTVYQRIAIVLAGPIMNFLFAILIFFCIVNIGEETKPSIAGDIKIESEAYKTGFRSGDKVLSVGSVNVTNWDQLQDRLDEVKGTTTEVKVAREITGEEATFPAEVKTVPNPNPLSLKSTVGELEGLNYISEAPKVAVQPGSLAETLGFKTGDIITQVNEQKISFLRELEGAFSKPGTYKVEVTRGDDPKKAEKLTIDFQMPTSTQGFTAIGLAKTHLIIAEVFKNTPAAKAGLMPGDQFLSIDGTKLTDWENVLNTIKSGSNEKPFDIVVLREGKPKDFKIVPEVTTQMTLQGKEEKRFAIGVRPMIGLTTNQSLIVRTNNPVTALNKAVGKTWDVTVMTIMGFVRMFQGQISPKNIGGFISIGQVAHDTFQIGLVHFFSMMAIISVNLFVLNLLPVPLLDGGHLLFYVVEMVKGSPMSLKKMEIAQQVGLALLLSLMVFALFNDFSRLFQNM
ncbi:MAG: RIP metalloprotease RseP [Bdellovibrionota bacterium]